MSHVIMQAAEFADLEVAKASEAALVELRKQYIHFEATDPNPWDFKEVPAPLKAFGARYGVDWPHEQSARFLLKGGFEEASDLIRIDRMVFFWGGGFDLGGPTLQSVFKAMGAVRTDEFCYLRVRHNDPDARVQEVVEFLEDEEFEEQFILDPEDHDGWMHLVVFEGPSHSRTIAFDDSGVSDWAFVALIPQLDGEDPSFMAPES